MESARAVVFSAPKQLELRELELASLAREDVLVDVEFTGVSTGTEKLLWSGLMPAFPGLGYPLVPGYEAVGRVIAAGDLARGIRVGERVFVPGSSGFKDARGLFGGAASRLVVRADRAIGVAELGQPAILLALAATAEHAIASGDGRPVELVVGHGALGRLLARLARARGHSPVVWETDPRRASGARGYDVVHPDADPRRDYRSIYDCSGDAALLDELVARAARGAEIVLGGFYPGRLSFAFAPAFMREVRLRVSAEWTRSDLESALAHVEGGRLDLDGLITHTRRAAGSPEIASAYETAFTDPDCLKMSLDWRNA